MPGRFGRRPTFLLSLALAVPVGLGVALAVNFLMVLVARLLFGAALAGAFLALYVARECGGGIQRGVGTGDAPGWGCSRVQDGTHSGSLTPCQGWSCVTLLTGWG